MAYFAKENIRQARFIAVSASACAALTLACLASAAGVKHPDTFVGNAWNPEDMVRLPGTPWVIVSSMPSAQRQQLGALQIVDTRQPEHAATQLFPPAKPLSGAKGPDAKHFFPHGLDVRALGEGRFELLVINHGAGEAIERFVLTSRDGQMPSIEHTQRIDLPAQVWANGVAYLPDGGFVTTSMFDPRDGNFVDKFASAKSTGNVWRASPSGTWSKLETPALSGANGIAVAADGSTAFVAEWAKQRLWKIALNGGQHSFVATSFLPDNLRWTADQKLLIAGQTAKPEQVFACEAKPRPCPMGYAVALVDPQTLAVEVLVEHNDTTAAQTGFGGATGAMPMDDKVWVGSFTGERIAVFDIDTTPASRHSPATRNRTPSTPR